MIDFERGAKTTGSKFYFLTGEDALRELHLINTMVDYHVNAGYTFVIPPYLIKRTTGEQAGILPRFEGDFYETQEGLVLIPTAETPLVGMHSDEIFREEDLPIKYVALPQGGGHLRQEGQGAQASPPIPQGRVVRHLQARGQLQTPRRDG